MYKRLFLTLALLVCLAPAATAGQMQNVDYDGLMNYVLDQQGKVVVVAFWATWCGPCLKEMPGLVELRDMYPKSDLEMVAVSLDFDPGAAKRYLKKQPLNLTLFLAGPDLMDLMEIKSIPKTLLFDHQGYLAMDHNGYLPKEALQGHIETLLQEAD